MAKPTLAAAKKVVIPLALDSGAHSLYNKYLAARDVGGKRLSGMDMIAKADLGYIKSPAFRKYLDSYVDCLERVTDSLEFAVTLDIIYNPEATWDIYKEMRKAGRDVLPVYHFGEDVKWLKRYMDETDYVGIGGLGQYNSKQNWLPFGIQTWKTILDKKGRPLVKTHGFAMSSFDLMSRWPWFSVDSTSACTFSRMGAVMMPLQRRQGPDYLTTPVIIPLATGRAEHKKHLGHAHPSGVIMDRVTRYLAAKGETVKSASGSYIVRDAINLSFMNDCMAALSEKHSKAMNKEWKTYYYSSGNPTDSIYTFDQVLERLERNNSIDHIRYLGTFFEGNRRAIEVFLKDWHNVDLRGPK